MGWAFHQSRLRSCKSRSLMDSMHPCCSELTSLHLQCEAVTDGQGIHLRTLQHGDGFIRITDNRLVLIEAGVQYDRYAGLVLEGVNELPIERRVSSIDRLE